MAAINSALMRRPFWPVLSAGLALALAISLSPVAVVMAAAMVVIIAMVCHDLRGRERTFVLVLLGFALALRVAAIAALFVWSDPAQRTYLSFPFDGDGWFMKHRALWIRNVWLGIPIDPQNLIFAFEPYGWSSYIYVIAYLQYLLAPAPFAVHLVNVVCFVTGALLLYRIVRVTFGAMVGSFTLIVTLFWPTLFLWSISALKESLYFLFFAAVVFGVWTGARGQGVRRRLAAVAVATGCTWALNSVRPGALLIVLAALVVTAVGTFVTRRFYLAVALLLVILVGSVRILDTQQLQTMVLPQLRLSANLHIGNVRTRGDGYKLLDQRFYSDDPLTTMTWAEAERFVLRSVSSFVGVPLPWQALSLSQMLFLPEQLAWYCLVILGALGAVDGLKSDVLVTWLLIGVCAAGMAAVAPNEGNIGTMVRHRDFIVPFVAALASVGLVWVLSRAVGVRRRPRPGGAERAGEPFETFTSSSVVAQAVSQMSAGSYLYALLAVLFQRTDTSAEGLTVCSEPDLRMALVLVAKQSVVTATLLRGVRVVHSAWSGSALADALAHVNSLDPVERIRLVGWVLLIGTSVAGIAGRFGDAAMPALFAWAATMVAAIVLIVASARRVDQA